jgi:hypothetical protein
MKAMPEAKRFRFGRSAGLPFLKLLYVLPLLLGITGSRCLTDRDLEPVIGVDVVAGFVAHGSENVYNGQTTVDLSSNIDLPKIMSDHQISRIKSISIEDAFFRIIKGDAAAPDRAVSQNVFTVREPGGPDKSLFTIGSVAVNDPAFVNWTPAPMSSAGAKVINVALRKLLIGQHSELTFTVSGQSTPPGIPTDFEWAALVRIQVVGVRKITVFEPF